MSIPISGKLVFQFDSVEDACEFASLCNKNSRKYGEKILFDLNLKDVELHTIATRDELLSNKQILQINSGIISDSNNNGDIK